MKRNYVLILNWNSWQDTIECIESVLKSNYKDFQIIVIDNASQDNSVDYIVKYLNRELFPPISEETKLKDRIIPFYKEKIPYIVYSEEEAVKGGNPEREKIIKLPKEINYPVIIIKNKGNYGFAKGNNTALKFALERDDFEYVWLLNNDTIVESNTLSNLIKEAEKDYRVGFVGSVIRYYDNPELIQTVGGGKFYPMLGSGKLYMKNKHVSVLKNLNSEKLSKYLNYIMGASLLIKKQVLEEIGIFDEDYFLYAEELDLITRGRKKGWKLAVALDSYVYHKESASTKDKKWLYYYLINKSNMIYLKKHYGIHYNLLTIPFILLNTLRTTKNFKNIKATIRGMIDGIKY
ncbi:glycosyltransferase family 2 protein [Desulfurobacterium sp.]